MVDQKKRAKSYWRLKFCVMLSGMALSVFLLALFQFAGISRSLADWSFSVVPNFYGALFVYMTVFGLAFGIVMFPLSIYSGFVLEHKFAISNQRLFSWLADEMKASIISYALSIVLIEALYVIIKTFPAAWHLVAPLFWVIVSLVVARLFPVIIIPLFFKYKPLSKAELRSRALSLAAKFGISVMDVCEIDFSAKTKKANAALVGWGRGRRIVVADNLVNEFTVDEAEVVLAHEFAHHALKHLWKMLFAGAASIFLFFFMLKCLSAAIAGYFGAGSIADMSVFPFLYLLFIIYNALMLPLQNTMCRFFERDADRLALKTTGLRDPFISLMQKLSLKNLADDDPNPVVEFIFYSHPSISGRITMARKMQL